MPPELTTDELMQRYALPMHSAMRRFDSAQAILDGFRVVPPEYRADVIVLLLALAVHDRPAEPSGSAVDPSAYAELVVERFGSMGARKGRS